MRHIDRHSIMSSLRRVYGRVPEDMRRPLGAALIALLVLALLPATGSVADGVKSVAQTGSETATAPADPRGVVERLAAGPSAADEAAPRLMPMGADEAVARPDTDKSKGEKPKGDEKAADKPAKKPDSEMVGFYVNWDESSYASLEKNIDDLTILMPEWYTVTGNGRLKSLDPDKQKKVLALIERENPDLKVMPIVNNFGPGTDPKAIAGVIKKAGPRKRLAEDIVKTMRKNGYEGVNIDFEGLTEASRTDLVRFMRDLYPLARKAKLEVSQDVLADSKTYDYEALAKNSDYLIPMMYDEHWKGSSAGPISSQGWYETSLRKFFDKVPPEKVVIALGTYSYDWGGGGKAEALTYPKARAKARADGTPIKLDEKSLNSTFTYESGGSRRRVWMLEAVSAFNQVKAASEHEPRGYAIWRLGGEDPGLWTVLPNRDALDKDVADELDYGRRDVKFDEERGLITYQRIAPK